MKGFAETWRQANLYFHTLRYLRSWQVIGRLYAAAKRRVPISTLPSPPATLHPKWAPALPFLKHEPWNRREDILEGRFRFLNDTRSLGWPVAWNAEGAALLWRFNLHYFHYLHLLEPPEQASLCRMWIAANPPGTEVAWHPYPTSLRIANWCKAGFEDHDLLASLYSQAAFVFRNLETYVMGNHLLENARSLVLAGSFFGSQGEAPRWLAKGLELYREETPEQVLHDGGFYERSPMYHALMLEGYLDVLKVLPDGHPDRIALEGTARAMTDFLVSLTHPDGNIALFNDSTQEIAAPTEALHAQTFALLKYDAQRRDTFAASGYFVDWDETIYFAIDGGSVGPEHLSAHAHADIFSFELSVHEQQFIVDTGVYEYAAGPMRDFVRSTAAHNTVAIDGLDQVECWGSFRVARRSAPYDVSFSRDREGFQFRGSFAGYESRLGENIVHSRYAVHDRTQRRLRVQDAVDGLHKHRVVSRLHLHPEVTVEADEGILRLQRGAARLSVEVEKGTYTMETGWYCPAFGLRQATRVIAIGGEAVLPVQYSYVLSY